MWLKAEIEKRGLLPARTARVHEAASSTLNPTATTGPATPSPAPFDDAAPVIAHEGVRTRILNTDMAEHAARIGTFGPEEPVLL